MIYNFKFITVIVGLEPSFMLEKSAFIEGDSIMTIENSNDRHLGLNFLIKIKCFSFAKFLKNSNKKE